MIEPCYFYIDESFFFQSSRANDNGKVDNTNTVYSTYLWWVELSMIPGFRNDLMLFIMSYDVQHCFSISETVVTFYIIFR